MTWQSPEIVTALRTWLGADGTAFFSEMLTKHGRIDALFSVPYGDTSTGPQKSFPHPVHLREGMQVRNFLRGLPETQNWTAHDYDERWVRLVELALATDK